MNKIQSKPSLSSSFDELRDQVEKQKIKIGELERNEGQLIAELEAKIEKLESELGKLEASLMISRDTLGPSRVLIDLQKDTIAELEKELNRTCLWKYDELYSMYEAACGQSWSFPDGGLEENDCVYCQKCRGKIVLEPEKK